MSTHDDRTPRAPSAERGEAFTAPILLVMPQCVEDLSLRLTRDGGLDEAYFNFYRASLLLSDTATIQYPPGGVPFPGAAPHQQVILIRRERVLKFGLFDQLAQAVCAVAADSPLTDFRLDPSRSIYELALDFLTHCESLGLACPRYDACATRREIAAMRESLERERAAASSAEEAHSAA